MADARFISKRISRDGRVAQLTSQSQLLYAYSIPILDNEGRMPGEPGAVRALAAKLLPWSDHHVDSLIAEWTQTTRLVAGQTEIDPLVIRYPLDPPCLWRDKELQLEFECRLALEFRGFHTNQPLRLRRGARSSLPPPDRCNVGQMVIKDAFATVDHRDHRDQKADVDAAASSLHARTRTGQAGVSLKVEDTSGQAKAAASPRARVTTIDTGLLDWFEVEFERTFGYASEPLRTETARSKLALALAACGRERAGVLLAERLAYGAEPRSITYFTQALTDAANGASRDPRGRGSSGLSTREILDIGQRLEAQGQ